MPTEQVDDWVARIAETDLPSPVVTEVAGRRTASLELWLPISQASDRTVTRWSGELGRSLGGSWRKLEDRDWVATSTPPRPPLKIRDRLLIVDPGDSDPVATEALGTTRRMKIAIPTGMAFGTGDHATTSTMLRWLVDESKTRSRPGDSDSPPEWSFLDVGCGTGILSLAAHLLGAKPVEGFDFDPAAVEISRGNAAANGIEDIDFSQADLLNWSPRDIRPQGWDVVAANVYGPVLVDAMPRLAAALTNEGTLLLSGILDRQETAVTTALVTAGLGIVRRKRLHRWVTIQASG